jgi:hypothetical protein
MTLAFDIAVIAGTSVFLLLGAWFLLVGGSHLAYALASPGWPKVAATVVASETSEHTDPVDRGSRASETTYEATIRFRYQVDGRDYTSETLHFGQSLGSGDSSDAELRHLRYPVGATVMLAYKPGNPAIAAPEPGFTGEAMLLPGAGLFFIAPAIMFLFMWFGISRENAGIAIGLGIFAAIFVAIGASLLTPGLVNLWRGHASESWPRAEGVVTYGKIDASRVVTETDRRNFSTTVRGAHLVYQYEVDGRQHFSNRRLFGQIAASGDDAALRIADRYPLGKKVSVAYAPGNPDLAVLEPGFQREALWLPGIGAAFLLFGLAAFIFAIPALTRDGGP